MAILLAAIPTFILLLDEHAQKMPVPQVLLWRHSRILSLSRLVVFAATFYWIVVLQDQPSEHSKRIQHSWLFGRPLMSLKSNRKASKVGFLIKAPHYCALLIIKILLCFYLTKVIRCSLPLLLLRYRWVIYIKPSACHYEI